MTSLPPPLRLTKDGVALPVHLTPRAGHDRVLGLETREGERVVKAQVRAVPDKGAANAALVKLLAKWLGLPKSVISLTSGSRARRKTVTIAGEPDAIAEAFNRAMAKLDEGGP